MYKYAFLMSLMDRRRQSKPIENDRRKPTRKQASEKLVESINNLSQTVQRVVERSGK